MSPGTKVNKNQQKFDNIGGGFNFFKNKINELNGVREIEQQSTGLLPNLSKKQLEI